MRMSNWDQVLLQALTAGGETARGLVVDIDVETVLPRPETGTKPCDAE